MAFRSLVLAATLSGAWLAACTGGDANDSAVIRIPDDRDTFGIGGGGAAGNAGEANAMTGSAGVDGGASDAAARADVNLVWPSTGCGKSLPENQSPTMVGSRMGYTKFTVMQTGATLAGVDPSKAVPRDIYVRVPADYDVNRPYRVVYLGQGCGAGPADQSTLPLFDAERGGDEQAIYVAISLPANQPNGACYDNRAGEASMEWEAFELFHTLVESTYCVDNNRIYVTGFSTGAWLANMWGCYFAELDPTRKFAPNFRIRGQGAVSGAQPENIVQLCEPPRPAKVAAIWVHSAIDATHPIEGSQRALDRVLTNNACTGSATEPWGDDALAEICERYVDCPEEFPVVFCTSMLPTQSGDQASISIPAFTQFLGLMDPRE